MNNDSPVSLYMQKYSSLIGFNAHSYMKIFTNLEIVSNTMIYCKCLKKKLNFDNRAIYLQEVVVRYNIGRILRLLHTYQTIYKLALWMLKCINISMQQPKHVKNWSSERVEFTKAIHVATIKLSDSAYAL